MVAVWSNILSIHPSVCALCVFLLSCCGLAGISYAVITFECVQLMVCCAVCDAETVLGVRGHYLPFFLSALNEEFVSGAARPNINRTAKPLAGIYNIHFDFRPI